MQQSLVLWRGQWLTVLLSVHADWGISAASCGSHWRPSEERTSLVCVGLQGCSQRAAWPLSAALSYLSWACPDSQPRLPRHKGGLVLGETGVSNPLPPPPLSCQADAGCNWATYLKLSNLERRVISATHSQLPYHKRLELHHCVTEIWSIHQRRLSQSKSITDEGCVLTEWHTDWQLYCVLWWTGMKCSCEEALQTHTTLRHAQAQLLVPLYAMLFLCIESASFSWQHCFSNCAKAAM